MKDSVRIALLVAVFAAAAAAWWLGWLDPESLRRTFAESGEWGAIGYVALFSFVQPFGVPGFIFITVALSIWPLGSAFVVIFSGSVGAGLVGSLFARFVARDWVTAQLPDWLRGIERRAARSPLRTVLAVRLTAYLFQPSHWALGVAPVGFGTLLLGTLIGFAPWAAAWTLAGGSALAWLGEQPREMWVAFAAVLGILAVLQRTWLRSRRRRASSAEPVSADPAG